MPPPSRPALATGIAAALTLAAALATLIFRQPDPDAQRPASEGAAPSSRSAPSGNDIVACDGAHPDLTGQVKPGQILLKVAGNTPGLDPHHVSELDGVTAVEQITPTLVRVDVDNPQSVDAFLRRLATQADVIAAASTDAGEGVSVLCPQR